MALTSGFYDAVNGDRAYNALQMSSIFDGIIEDGVFASYGEALQVATNGTDMSVYVKTGRAWFKHTWIYNDTYYALNIATAAPLLPRIDAIVVEVDRSTSIRNASFKVVQGTPASSPKRPSLVKTVDVNQYALAYVTVPAAATKITTANITNVRGTTETPFVTGPLKTLDVEPMLAQWRAVFNEMIAADNTQWTNNFNAKNSAWDANYAAKNSQFEAFMNASNSSFDSFMERSSTAFDDFIEAEDAEFDESMLEMREDFNSFWTEFKAGMVEYLSQQELIWENWFQRIQGQLSEDAATNLQRQIDSLCFVYILEHRAILGIACSVLHRKAVFGTYGSVANNKIMITAPTHETVGVNGRRAMLATSGTVVGDELAFNPNSETNGDTVTVHGEPINN